MLVSWRQNQRSQPIGPSRGWLMSSDPEPEPEPDPSPEPRPPEPPPEPRGRGPSPIRSEESA
ncbi:hypothetical protein DVJ78_17455 [Humibacter sp. BT305]|nr:hypothetical protein DVJ78_17455 [Humibacter sp. BT305]